ncbi:MAG TPA: divalent metal cation transporter [Candidatus Bathyarchaeia archaeon]|nr:divalent metal cation transporter [Candidatus Bathyarchaeia archaeon]
MKRILDVLKRLGPGLITASVVIGPGSIVAASRAGAEGGYRLLWLVGFSALLMGVYASMGARLGCALDVTPLQYVARRAGRPLAVLTGLSAFLVTAGFQFGNNMGVAFAAQGLVGAPQYAWIWPIVFTVLALLFLHTASRVYVAIERLMMVLVAIMILCFFANLFWTGLDLPRLMWGLVPQMGRNDLMFVRAIVPTTFSAVAAFYQAYLVQAKGWQRNQIRRAIADSWIGILAVTLISASILAGAAETLHGTDETVGSVGQLALILRKLLGPAAGLVFCLGLGAAAFSSFIVNAVIGGSLLADGLGLDGRINSRPVRLLASVVMLIGCGVAVGAFAWGAGTTTSLLLAQASTLIAAPLCALILLVLSSRGSTMGGLKNGLVTTILGIAGLVVILALGIMWALD